ncbi:MAG: hypothetical protein ACE5EI_03420 [Thermodesulfobacteriota bacterium]
MGSAHPTKLGRIFDQTSSHNIDRLLGLAQKHRDIFLKDALAERKKRESANAEEFLDGYLEEAYEPLPKDFRRLRSHVNKYRKIYQKNYRNIRHKVYAHKAMLDKEEVQELFSKTNILELQKLSVFLIKLHEALWQLLNNGRRPILRAMPFSVRSIKKRRLPKWQGHNVQELIIKETQKFFNILVHEPKIQ